MRVLIPLHGFIGWNGGIDLVRLLVSAIDHRTSGDEIDLIFALPTPLLQKRMLLSVSRRWRELRSGYSVSVGGRASNLRRIAEQIVVGRPVVLCAEGNSGILQAVQSSGSDIVFPAMQPLGKAPIRRIGYVYDFQHRYLPNLFSEREIRKRDEQFCRIAEDSTGIVVNARTVAQDVERILKFPSSRILSMPFTPYAHSSWFDQDPLAISEKYGIHGKYVLVCNHFWKHKDHATALRAFAMLRSSISTEDLQLVMTGDPVDYRDPVHFRHLLALCTELGIKECTHFLGLIPKLDQLALLRGSGALIQPTLFEGGPGGGAVLEAVGVGTPAVVSDIPVNLEIDQGDVRFFKTGDAFDLAEKTLTALLTPSTRPDTGTLLSTGEQNLAHLGNSIASFLRRMAIAPPRYF